jgi:serine/threonine-protein kinase
VYSLGIVLYEMPEPLEAIVLKAINKNPANRYATATELRADLRRYLAGRPVMAEPLLPLTEGSDITAAVPAAAFGGAALAGAMADPTATRSVPMEPHTVVVTRPAADGGYPPEPPPRRRWGLVALAVLLLLAALAGGLFLLLRSLDVIGAEQVTVPEVVGLTSEEAEARLSDEGLVAVIRGVVDPAPVGQVLRQDPGPGREVDDGSEVVLDVSTGPQQADVPDVVGGTEEEARFTLAANGFTVGDVVRQQDEADDGTVLDQTPAAGDRVDAGTTVSLVVSSGPAPVVVPDVRNLSPAEAAEALARARLDAVDGGTRPSDTVPPGLVVDTDPAPGRSVERDARVVYFVSSGPTTTTTSSTTTTTSTTEPDGNGNGNGGGGGGGGGGND